VSESLHTARRVIAEQPTAREFFDVMTRRYPDRLNPGTVWLDAQRLARLLGEPHHKMQSE
jgi:hypothetical protein